MHYSKIAALAMAFVLLSGCAQKPAETGFSGSGITLSVVSPFGEGDGYHDAYNSLIGEYAEQYKVTVEDNSQISTEEWKSGVLDSFTAGAEPDVLFYFTAQDAEPFVSADKVVDLDTIRSVYSDYALNIAPAVLNNMRAADGKNYAVPVIGYWEGLYINRDLFDEHSVKAPVDWAGLETAIQKFRAVGIVPIAISLGEVPHNLFEFLVYNYTGPSGHLRTVPTGTDDVEYWVNGLTDFRALSELGAFPEDTDTITNLDAIGMFSDKRAAMYVGASWDVGTMNAVEGAEVTFFPAKTGMRRHTDLIGGFSMGFYISKKAWDDPAKREAAVLFVKSMASDEGIGKFAAGGGAAPVSRKLELGSSQLMQSVASMQSEATAYTASVQDTLKKEAREALFSAIPDIAGGRLSPEAAIEEFVKLN